VVENLGDMETTSVKTLDEAKHIEALENLVDELREQLSVLQAQVSERPDHIDYKERYEQVVVIYHELLDSHLPF
jgi:regulator of replication initiation timing